MPYIDRQKQREYQREWRITRRTEWLLENGPCCRCGSWIDLEVDHVDPAKKLDHRVWSWSKKRREEELAKCQVLCASCHDAKSAADRKERIKHGGATMYARYRCRCPACRQWKSEENKLRRR